MVSFTNGGLSCENSCKGPLVNGYMSKWKPRKVSAVRDFPPRCGRNAVPIKLQSEENGASGKVDLEGSAIIDSDIGNAVTPNGIGNGTAKVEVMDIGNSETINGMEVDDNKICAAGNENAVDSGGIENSKVGVDCPSHEAVASPIDVDIDECLDVLVGKATASACGVEDVMMETGTPETQLQNKVDGQTDIATSVPIQVERAESLDVLVGQVATEVDGFPNNVDELKTEAKVTGADLLNNMKGGSSVERTKAEGDSMHKELNETDVLASVRNSCMDEAKLVPKGVASVDEVMPGSSHMLSSSHENITPEFFMRLKYCRRKDTAARDFPQNCGMNAPLPMEEEKKTGALGNDCLDSTENNEVEQVATMSNGSKAVIDNSIEDSGGKLGIKMSSEDGNDFTTGKVLHRAVVLGLMAAPHCPWRKKKVFTNNSDIRPSGGKLGQQNWKSVAVILNSSPKERSNGASKKKRADHDHDDTNRSLDLSTFLHDEDGGSSAAYPAEKTPFSKFKPDPDYSSEESAEPLGKDIFVYSPGNRSDNVKSSHSALSSADEEDKEALQGLMAACNSPSRKRKVVSSNSVGSSGVKVQKKKPLWRSNTVSRKATGGGNFSGGSSKKPKGGYVSDDEDGGLSDGELLTDSPVSRKMMEFDVRLPPFGPNGNDHNDARNTVRVTLRLFHSICRKLLQKEEVAEEECESKVSSKKLTRIDLATAKIIKDKGKQVNTGKLFLGVVPGVEVGDEFQYRVELAVVGIHRLYQAGIDSMKVDGEPVATSIVTSGAYDDDTENADVLIYTGQGGNALGKCKIPKDQKLEKGNLALSNSASMKTPVRVVRGWRETVKGMDPLDPKPKLVSVYVYDGLYTVERYWTEPGPHGKIVFKFKLTRNPGQPELAWKELKKASKSKYRPGACVTDISGGKERFPICAVNVLDEEKPPKFHYISTMKYPDWYSPSPPVGCDCVGRCNSRKCRCAVRNGGEIPYNHNGAIVETKDLVYECGPHCKCPPTCYNRVTQRGIKVKLEIFKTEGRGWGLRALTSIPSGSFICEYAGELLEDNEAEERIGNDEYLFDIGQNYTDFSLNPEEQKLSVEITEEGGYTIDACQYGNVGRFVNHSCSPNLYAQNVIYDHDEKKMAHMMLFAAENIPPLQELTYHYNYNLNQVLDSNGNIKIKKCFCGSLECIGRMY